MSIRYTPATGESVCLTCGEIVLSQPPVWARSTMTALLNSAEAGEAASASHRCGLFTDWPHARATAAFPHERADVRACWRRSHAPDAFAVAVALLAIAALAALLVVTTGWLR